MRKEAKLFLTMGGIAGMASLLFGAVRLKFPARANLREVDTTHGQRPATLSQQPETIQVIVPTNHTANIQVMIDGRGYNIHVQDGGKLRIPGAHAVVAVKRRISTTYFFEPGTKSIFGMPETDATYLEG